MRIRFWLPTGLAAASKELHIAPLDLNGLAGHNGVIASSIDSEATFSDALLGSSAPSPSTVLPLHPSQVTPRAPFPYTVLHHTPSSFSTSIPAAARGCILGLAFTAPSPSPVLPLQPSQNSPFPITIPRTLEGASFTLRDVATMSRRGAGMALDQCPSAAYMAAMPAPC